MINFHKKFQEELYHSVDFSIVYLNQLKYFLLLYCLNSLSIFLLVLQNYYFQSQAFQKLNINLWLTFYVNNSINISIRVAVYILSFLVISIFYHGFSELDSPFIFGLRSIKFCDSTILYINYNPISETILKFVNFANLLWSNIKSTLANKLIFI